jgi:hypothetical protein
MVLDVPESALLGLLRSLVFVGLHREEIGPELVKEMTTWLKQSLRAALRPTAHTRRSPSEHGKSSPRGGWTAASTVRGSPRRIPGGRTEPKHLSGAGGQQAEEQADLDDAGRV